MAELLDPCVDIVHLEPKVVQFSPLSQGLVCPAASWEMVQLNREACARVLQLSKLAEGSLHSNGLSELEHLVEPNGSRQVSDTKAGVQGVDAGSGLKRLARHSC